MPRAAGADARAIAVEFALARLDSRAGHLRVRPPRRAREGPGGAPGDLEARLPWKDNDLPDVVARDAPGEYFLPGRPRDSGAKHTGLNPARATLGAFGMTRTRREKTARSSRGQESPRLPS